MYSHILKRQSIASDEQDFFAYPVANLCQSCGHLTRDQPTTCAAFPKGIPVGILMGAIDHTVGYSYGGVNDGGLTYVPEDGAPPQEGETIL
jgi:hypothetical protein